MGAGQAALLLEAGDSLARGQELVGKDASQAITAFEQSRDLFARLGDECDAAVAESWAAQMLRDVGRLDEARTRLSLLVESAGRKNFVALLPPGYYWLGMADFNQGRFSESAKNLKTGLKHAEATENVFEIQHAEDALAKNYAKLGELAPALAYAGRRFSDQTFYYQRGPNQYWRDMGTLVELMLKLDFPATSLSVAKEMLNFAEANSFKDSRLNDSLRHVVEASLVNDDLSGALDYANTSLQHATQRGDTPEAATTRAEIYRVIGDINRKGNNCREALAGYDRALELYGRLAEVTPASYQIHKGKLSCFRELNDEQQFAGELKLVLKLTEEYRQNIREDTSRQAFFDDQQDVFDTAIEHAIGNGDARAAFGYAEESKARSLLQFIESPKSIAEVENSFGDVARPLDLAEIQARLPGQVELVQYSVLPDRLVIWTISASEFNFDQKQVSAKQLEQKITDYQALVSSKGSISEIERSSRELYALLIPAHLSHDQQVCIVADKFLHRLAFATLLSESGSYLLENHLISYAPSASILIVATENARRKTSITNERLLSIGNPAFDREENPELPELSDAESEAHSIAENYPQSIQLLGADATRQSFLSNFTRAEVIHFAGHFVTNSKIPGNSKFLLAGGELRSSELEATKLPRAKLVILSACETALETYNPSEGSIGVARTFLALGAPLVIASQWKVDSATTRDLMISFHRNRRQKGMNSAESLRQAQLELFKRKETSSPFYWAAFSLYGGYANY